MRHAAGVSHFPGQPPLSGQEGVTTTPYALLLLPHRRPPISPSSFPPRLSDLAEPPISEPRLDSFLFWPLRRLCPADGMYIRKRSALGLLLAHGSLVAWLLRSAPTIEGNVCDGVSPALLLDKDRIQDLWACASAYQERSPLPTTATSRPASPPITLTGRDSLAARCRRPTGGT